MPAVSKKQFRFMAMLAHNPEKMRNKPKGLSSSKAEEFVSKTPSYKKLPEKKFSRLGKHMK